jgi:hypothetical protein
VAGDPVNQFDLTGECLFGKRKGGGCRGGVRAVANGFNAVKRGTKADHAANWVVHRWNKDTTSVNSCYVLVCISMYTYRDAHGRRRLKNGIQVGLSTPGPSVTTSSGRPGKSPTSSWSGGYGACIGRSTKANGWNFTLGPGHCSGVYSGP